MPKLIVKYRFPWADLPLTSLFFISLMIGKCFKARYYNEPGLKTKRKKQYIKSEASVDPSRLITSYSKDPLYLCVKTC